MSKHSKTSPFLPSLNIDGNRSRKSTNANVKRNRKTEIPPKRSRTTKLPPIERPIDLRNMERTPTESIARFYSPTAQHLKISQFSKKCRTEFPELRRLKFYIPNQPKKCHTWEEMKALDFKSEFPASESRPMSPECQCLLIQEIKTRKAITKEEIDIYQSLLNLVKDDDFSDFDKITENQIIKKVFGLFNINRSVKAKLSLLLMEAQRGYRFSMKKSTVEYMMMDTKDSKRLKMPTWPISKEPIVIRAPVPWKDNCEAARRFCNDFLFVSSPIIVNLNYQWTKSFLELSFINTDEFDKTSFTNSKLLENVTAQCKRTRRHITDVWITKVADAFANHVKYWKPMVPRKGDNSPSERVDALFSCVASFCSHLIRNVATKSINGFVDYINNYKFGNDYNNLTSIKNFIRNPLIIIELVVQQSKITFEPNLESVEKELIDCVKEVVKHSDKLPKVELIMFPEMKHLPLFLLSIKETDELLQNAIAAIVAVFKKNIIGIQKYIHIYDKYLLLIDPNLDLEYENYIKMKIGTKKFRDKLKLLTQLYDEIILLPQQVAFNLFLLDNSRLHEQLCQKINLIKKRVVGHYVDKNYEINRRLCSLFEEMCSRAGETPTKTAQLVELSDYLRKQKDCIIYELKEDVENVARNLFFFVDYTILSERDINFNSRVFNWPKTILNMFEMSNARIAMRQDQIEIDLRKKIAEFEIKVAACTKELEIIRKRDPSVLKIEEMRISVALLQRLSIQLDEVKQELSSINEEEQLLGDDPLKFPTVNAMISIKEPYDRLWNTALTFTEKHEYWYNGPFGQLDADAIAEEVETMWRTMYKLTKTFADFPGPKRVAENVKARIEKFKNMMPVLQMICNAGMRERHWQMVGEIVGQDVALDDQSSLARMIEIGLPQFANQMEEISIVASKEHSLERSLAKMKSEWSDVCFDLTPYRETGVAILVSVDDVQLMLDDHILRVQTMRGSPFIKSLETQVKLWEDNLILIQDILDAWLKCQATWLYLEPIFGSDDIVKQMPVESRKFQRVDQAWREIMGSVTVDTHALVATSIPYMLQSLEENNRLLEEIQKGLNDYLDKKRLFFPRFFFLSNDELLEILSETKDPSRVQPHLKKCFEGIRQLEFDENDVIRAMISSDGERIPFSRKIYPLASKGLVEKWLAEVEDVMVSSMKDNIKKALHGSDSSLLSDWVLQWPGQSVLCTRCIKWTAEVTKALIQHNSISANHQSMSDWYNKYLSHSALDLETIVNMVRGNLNPRARIAICSLIVIEVHARDVIAKLAAENVEDAFDFTWISQLRYYWEETKKAEITSSTINVKMITTEVAYGFEYLGNTSRLVITPLTDRCYRTLMGAFKLNLGAAPEGPAGTGKTETVKDLAKAVAKQCVVFNCSEGLDYQAMGKFFKGLAQAGAWACFDEFNRINLEVLSVISQQIRCIQTAKANAVNKFIFEGTELTLNPSCAMFITMNPGYSGRLDLPDNLKVLFRSVAMMVPDYALIGEISLYSYGFVNARELSRKIIHTYRLCAEQLSQQPHYDYGMRAIKAVLIAASHLKLQHPEEKEAVLVLKSLKTINAPKFTAEDLPLFNDILTDLFPEIKVLSSDNQNIQQIIVQVMKEHTLQSIPEYVEKIIQVCETMLVRHGLMIIGGPLSGKTTAYRILAEALSRYHQQDDPDYKVVYKVINPKSASVGQLYGYFDPINREFSDGILASTFREFAIAAGHNRRWIIFDGPVDTGWVEHMNTVLDDNKKLCLMNSEIIQMNENMSLIFESANLEATSPATVSRCGMIYLEPSSLGWKALKESYMDSLSNDIERVQKKMTSDMFDWLFPPVLDYVQKLSLKFISTNDMHLVTNTIRLYDGLLTEIRQSGKDGRPVIQNQQITNWLQALFLFALVWGVAGTVTNASRIKFDEFFRNLIYGLNEKFVRPTTFRLSRLQMFPEKKTVFDYIFECRGNGQWVSWLDGVDKNQPKLFSHLRTESIVPTDEVARQIYFLNYCISHEIPLLVVGPTGTGKTIVTNAYLSYLSKERFVTNNVNFSFRTTVKQAQEMIMSRLDRRRKGVFGPPLNRQCIVFIDDINISSKDNWGSQPSIELLRQWVDNGHWYDQKDNSKLELVETHLVSAMNSTHYNEIDPRFLRHFHLLSVDTFDDIMLSKIFGTLVEWHFGHVYDANIFQLSRIIVQATISLYKNVLAEFLPKPEKSHYVYNLRDLSRVIHGILQVPASHLRNNDKFIRLWIHETYRVFHDRLSDENDRNLFFDLVKSICHKEFRINLEVILSHLIDPLDSRPQVVPAHIQQLFFGDYTDTESDQPIYDEIMDPNRVVETMKEYLKDHDMVTRTPMNLLLFHHTVDHVSRLHRVLTQDKNGHALLIGISGSGRRSVARLAAFMAGMEVLQVEMSRNYGIYEWREDIKTIIRRTGTEGKSFVFLFAEDQMRDDAFLEDLNVLLISGDITNLYTAEERSEILEKIQAGDTSERVDNSPMALYGIFLERVRQNLHIVITISPVGNSFRNRLRNFIALTSCCTIDWFSTWPKDALHMVAENYFSEMNFDEEIKEKCVIISCYFHQSVVDLSQRYFIEFGRWNYVTPTAYLELLKTFKQLIVSKRTEITELRNRYVTGLDKLDFAASQVTLMQAQLIEEQPKLIKTTEETEQLMIKIEKDTIEVEAKKEVVAADEALANNAAAEAQAIKDECENDLAEATPALESAISALNTLKPQDVTVIKSMKNPPSGVKLVMEAICIMKGIKPERKPEPGGTGKMTEDYWGPSLKLVSDLKFLEHLKAYNKDDVPPVIMKVIRQRYISNPEFDPYVIRQVSAACEGLCQWICAVEVYDRVAKIVAPKREKLGKANSDLGKQMEKLNEKRNQLQEVTDKLQILNDEFIKKTKEKKDLEDRIDLCRKKLERAAKLIGGLGGEKQRWCETSLNLASRLENVVGDIIIASGTIAYLGAFTANLRQECIDNWLKVGRELGLTFSTTYSLVATLGNPLHIRDWHIAGLPIDQLSTDNAIIVSQFRKFPLMIDPQGQANKWIKTLENNNKLEILKLSDTNYLRTLGHCVQLGNPVLIEDIGYDIDPLLQSLLLKQTFKKGAVECIQLSDNIVEYHQDFRLYFTTRLPNPHYQPHVTVMLTVLNFTITPFGLEDQLLGLLVAKEKPELELEKNQLIIENANNQKQLKEIEDKILEVLSTSQGDILEDETTIDILSSSKSLAVEIKAKQEIGVTTEKAIDEIRNLYRTVASNASTLFFCISELAFVDPMYQYSLNWFINLYIQSITSSKKTVDTAQRISCLIEHFTVSIYRNVCRSLFEKDRLVFSCILCIGILKSQGQLNESLWNYILNQGVIFQESLLQNPAPKWLSESSWEEIVRLSTLSQFKNLTKHFIDHPEVWRPMYESPSPHSSTLPPSWSHLKGLEKVALIKCLRPDKLVETVKGFIKNTLGSVYMESLTFDISESYADSNSCTPLIFILSPGADPTIDLLKFGQERGQPVEKIHMLSLGQGQGPVASHLIEKSLEDGSWVVLQNCHLVPSWFSTLEKICETMIIPEVAHEDFRLWLTCYPCHNFPIAILQNGVKMTTELSYDLKANLLRAYQSSPISDFRFLDDGCPRHIRDWQRLLYGLCFFHGVVRERRNFGPLGWNIPYEFSNADLRISISQLQMFLSESRDGVPVKALTYLTGEINYGGRITDDWDQRLLMSLLSNVYNPDVANLQQYPIIVDKDYWVPTSISDYDGYLQFIHSLPPVASPSVFGLHDNAVMAKDKQEASQFLTGLASTKPRIMNTNQQLPEASIIGLVSELLNKIPSMFDNEILVRNHPMSHGQCLNIVLHQEIKRFTRLLQQIRSSLTNILLASSGHTILTPELEKMSESILLGNVPLQWLNISYTSGKSLAGYIHDLILRYKFFEDWIKMGEPTVFWISGFFFAQAFLTGVLQQHARKYSVSIESLVFDCEFVETSNSSPPDGVYIKGLFLKGARWDKKEKKLAESFQRVYTDPLPVIWLKPCLENQRTTAFTYECPVYLTSDSRKGNSANIGEKSNFIFSLNIPSDKDPKHWINRGVACLCQVDE